ncbi:alpha/beta hydrolase fold protein [Jimgerdemannia flammicorona]|uniref:Alpha/beta hydrolase fold protein n=2 Tax=Jimgerdemannia flammicorona TaxID=994334 RepID=A0A433QS32_9FUNG|nr:alpha/beta hydrolase fold protein [Jimgerdemannia flammicorona]RUS32602.1 alpha/beta hydrolase fold protein [Jimgerdemannia flammicorona]
MNPPPSPSSLPPPDLITEGVQLPAGVSLHTTRRGTSLPAIVCLHGGPGMWDYFDRLSLALSRHYTVYTYSQRACGLSSASPPPYNLSIWLSDLERLRTHWGVSRWIVLGHSFGASLALVYALAHPTRVRGLIYVSGTGVGFPEWHDAYRSNRATLLGPDRLGELREMRQKARNRPATVVPYVMESYKTLEREASVLSTASELGCFSADPDRAYEMAREIVSGGEPNLEVNRVLGHETSEWADAEDFVERNAIEEVLADVPILMVHGAADPRPSDGVRKIATAVPGAKFVEFEGVGHWPFVEDLEGFVGVVKEFLKAV